MIDENVLAAFTKTNMGWLSNDGEILTCPLHAHFERLATVPVFEDAYNRFRDICDGNETAMQEDLDGLDPDEHPAMHRFSGMNDDARDEFVKVVYTSGWVRLGRALDLGVVPVGDRVSRLAAFRSARSWYVEAEGLTVATRRHRRVLQELADALDCRLVVREMRYESVNLGSKRNPRVVELLVPETYRPE